MIVQLLTEQWVVNTPLRTHLIPLEAIGVPMDTLSAYGPSGRSRRRVGIVHRAPLDRLDAPACDFQDADSLSRESVFKMD